MAVLNDEPRTASVTRAQRCAMFGLRKKAGAPPSWRLPHIHRLLGLSALKRAEELIDAQSQGLILLASGFLRRIFLKCSVASRASSCARLAARRRGGLGVAAIVLVQMPETTSCVTSISARRIGCCAMSS